MADVSLCVCLYGTGVSGRVMVFVISFVPVFDLSSLLILVKCLV